MATSKSVFHIAGDKPAPGFTQLTSGQQSSGINVVLGRPMLLYKIPHSDAALILEADVFEDPMKPGELGFIHLLCPRCLRDGRSSGLRISPTNKRIYYDPKGTREPFPGWTAKEMRKSLPGGELGGLLSVERFRCTWEETPDQRRSFGSICGWHVEIDRNIVRDV